MVLNGSLPTLVKGVSGYLGHYAEGVLPAINVTEKIKSSVLIGCYGWEAALLKTFILAFPHFCS